MSPPGGRALDRAPDPAARTVGPPPDLVLPGPWSATPVTTDGPALSRVVAWMAAPHVAGFWRQDWPAAAWADEVRRQRAGAHSRPWLVALDGEPVAYVETYRVARDVIASHHPVAPHDLGVHLAIGDPHRVGKGLGRALLAAAADALLAADPACGRVLGDPEATHVVARRAFAAAGFVDVCEVDLPHKRAALMARDRLSRTARGRAVTARLAGLGAVTGYGWGVDALEAGLAAHKPAVAPAHVDGLDVVAAVVPDRGAEPGDPNERYEQAVLAAVDEAVAEADRQRVAAGAGRGGAHRHRHLRHPHRARQLLLGRHAHGPACSPASCTPRSARSSPSATAGPGPTSWSTPPARRATSPSAWRSSGWRPAWPPTWSWSGSSSA